MQRVNGPVVIEVYTDGSSSKNGKPDCIAGWAFVIPDFHGKMIVRYGYLPEGSSNNKGEIIGVLKACEMFSKQDYFLPVIHSDSRYVINSCNEWRKDWANSNYEGVKNINLLKPLFDFIDTSRNKPILKWVKGHAGNVGNELADKYCGMGKRQEIVNQKDDKFDIRFIPYDELGYNQND